MTLIIYLILNISGIHIALSGWGGESPAGAGFNWVTEGNDFKGKAEVEKLVITPTF
jgi:hypothetical protein